MPFVAICRLNGAGFQKGKQIINLGRRSFRARVLYFGYSPREESRLQCPRDSMGARAGMVRFNEAHDKWGLSDEEVFAGGGWIACSRDGCSRVGCGHGRQGTAARSRFR